MWRACRHPSCISTLLHDLDWIAWPWAPASGSTYHLELCGLRALKSGRLPLGLFDPSPREIGKGHLANRAGADHGCGARESRPACPQCRPLLRARESASSRRTRRAAGAPVPLGCTCDSKGAPGVSWCTCGIRACLCQLRCAPGSNYAPPRCTWHLQVHLRGEYGPQDARCTWR